MSTHIFQQSLDFDTVPTQWKHAYVTPVFKKAVNQILKTTALFHLCQWSVNSRSIIIIVSQIMKHLEKNNILTDSQFGFRVHHSCKPQLFITINDIAKAIDEKLQVDAAILDFSKAFDKVAHSRLLYKFVGGSYIIG